MLVQPAFTVEQFEALPPAEKRIAVARDVLAQLDAERYVAASGIYVETDASIPVGDLREGLLSRDPKCHVCAKGAVFLSHVRLGDRFTSDGTRLGVNVVDSLGSSGYEQEVALRFEIWGRGLAANLEAWFEDFDEDGEECSEVWGALDVDARLRALMENIIRNGGELVAEQLPDREDAR